MEISTPRPLLTKPSTHRKEKNKKKKERIFQRHTYSQKTERRPKRTKGTRTTPQKHVVMNGDRTPTWPCIKAKLAAGLLTRHAGVSAEAAVELTVHQGGVEQPLAEQVEDAVDLGPGRRRQGPRLPAALVGAGEEGGRGRGLLLRLLLLRLLLLLLGAFGWLTAAAL